MNVCFHTFIVAPFPSQSVSPQRLILGECLQAYLHYHIISFNWHVLKELYSVNVCNHFFIFALFPSQFSTFVKTHSVNVYCRSFIFEPSVGIPRHTFICTPFPLNQYVLKGLCLVNVCSRPFNVDQFACLSSQLIHSYRQIFVECLQ